MVEEKSPFALLEEELGGITDEDMGRYVLPDIEPQKGESDLGLLPITLRKALCLLDRYVTLLNEMREMASFTLPDEDRIELVRQYETLSAKADLVRSGYRYACKEKYRLHGDYVLTVRTNWVVYLLTLPPNPSQRGINALATHVAPHSVN